MPRLDLHFGQICKQNTSIFCCWLFYLTGWDSVQDAVGCLMQLPCFQPDCLHWILMCLRLRTVEPGSSSASSKPSSYSFTNEKCLLHFSSLRRSKSCLSLAWFSSTYRFVSFSSFLTQTQTAARLVATLQTSVKTFGVGALKGILGKNSWPNKLAARSVSSSFSRVCFSKSSNWNHLLWNIGCEILASGLFPCY